MRKYLNLFWIFFRIGIFTIGGGIVMLPVMQREFVERRKWVDNEKMTDIFSVAQSLPGVIALNSSIYIGYELYGFRGAIAAALGITIPSFMCILILFFALGSVGDNVYLGKFYTGVRAAVVALITIAALKLSKTAVKDFFGVLIVTFGIVATLALGLGLPVIVISCGFLGYLYYCHIKLNFERISRRGKQREDGEGRKNGS